ncbi:MAG: hypothetical protein AAF228_13770 [Pseudomonadota bacterium]
MSKQETIDDIMPSAVATDDEIRRWNALPEAEKEKRFLKAIDDGFNSGVSHQSVNDIISEAQAELKAEQK